MIPTYKDGDRSVLTSMFHEHRAAVTRLLELGCTMWGGRRVLGCPDPEDRADLLQETFARAFSEGARARFDPARPFRPFVLRIAKNLLIDRARARRGKEWVPLAVRDLPSEGGGLEERLDAVREARAARAYLALLRGEARQVAHAWLVLDASETETARSLQISRRRVRSLRAGIEHGLLRHLESTPAVARGNRTHTSPDERRCLHPRRRCA